MKIEQNVPLAPLSTFRIGGSAAYLCRIKYIQDLEEAADFIKKTKLPFFILGEGSNTLVADVGFAGVILKMELSGVRVKPLDDKRVEIEAGAGEHWDSLVELAVSKGLYGIENLSGIPGTVGAAPVQNIGAYGAEVKDVISFVEVFDLSKGEHGELRTMTPDECRFTYRDSVFKSAEGKNLIITKVGFVLEKNGRANIGYKDLKVRFEGRATDGIGLDELRQAVLDIRAKKLPDVHKIGTVGSFFKNPFVTAEHFERLHAKWPSMPGFPEDGRVKIPLAWIIDTVCGMKGWRNEKGTIGLYELQPIAVVNLGGGTAEEVKETAKRIADTVKEKTGIEIEWEVRILE